MSQTPRVLRLVRLIVPLLIAVALLAQGTWFQRTTSAVWDEVIYLTAGLDFYHHGHIARFVIFGIAPLPVMLSYLAPALSFGADQLAPAEFVRAIASARVVHLLLVGLPLVLLPYAWMTRRRGLLAGATVGVMLACSPAIVAFSALAVTDAMFALAFLLALAVLGAYVRRPSARGLVLTGLACGGALATKYTALLLFPLAGLVILWAERPSAVIGAAARGFAGWLRAAVHAAGRTAALAAMALLVVWALHGFAVDHVFSEGWAPPPSLRGPVGETMGTIGKAIVLPAPVKAMVFQIQHASGGQPQFLWGQKNTRGWWYYYPVALLLKSTPAELLMAALLPFLLWRARRQLDGSAALLLLAAGLVLMSALTSRLDIGVRYVLVLYPLVFLLVVDSAAAIGAGRRWLPALLALFMVLQAGSAIGAAPRYLSYFNTVFTPAGDAYKAIVDSNLDWGQDLPALKAALAERGTDRVLLAYFGAAPPEAYGIQATPWESPNEAEVAGQRWIAISATLMNGVYLRADPFQEFRRIPPDARPADSLFLYDATRPDVQRALAVTRSKIPSQPCRTGATSVKPDDPALGAIGHWHIRCNGV